jgi:hypothetical protein
MGHAVCRALDAGEYTPGTAVEALRHDDHLGYDDAATIAGFAISPFTAAAIPQLATAITHFRDVLGDPKYETLAREGETMTPAAMATYAYDQIDQARAELSAIST